MAGDKAETACQASRSSVCLSVFVYDWTRENSTSLITSQRERQRERQREGGRERERKRDRERKRETEKDREREKEKETEVERERGRERERETDGERGREKGREREKKERVERERNKDKEKGEAERERDVRGPDVISEDQKQQLKKLLISLSRHHQTGFVQQSSGEGPLEMTKALQGSNSIYLGKGGGDRYISVIIISLFHPPLLPTSPSSSMIK